ncbi:MAG: glycoside hydrolase family 76 protein [Tepidisphaeraceae bacterium]
MTRRRRILTAILTTAISTPAGAAVPTILKQSKTDYTAAATEVMRQIERGFSLDKSGLYAHSLADRKPDFMWGHGVMFSALVGAVRHDPKTYTPRMMRYFRALDRYWDAKAPIPGYEPAPTSGNGNDKYYDDNAWMVITFAEAYSLTRDEAFLKRARQAMTFVLSGEDNTLGGGIWWHERHKDDSKNTCANAPTVVGLLNLASLTPAREKEWVDHARRLTEWTTNRLQLPSGLYADKVTAATGVVEKTTWTYNTGLMIRAYLGLYRQDRSADTLKKAITIAGAADALLDPKSGAYHDGLKFTHLMAEADIELYRVTGDERWLGRAVTTADVAYATWKTQPSKELIDAASLARLLWLLSDLQTGSGAATR